jgi:hypothetical protein
VQDRVVGLSNAGLQRLAAADAAQDPDALVSRAESFWHASPDMDDDPPRDESPNVQAIRLETGLVLSLAAARTLEEDDLRVIRMASAPLIEILRLRGLIGVGPSSPPKGDVR